MLTNHLSLSSSQDNIRRLLSNHVRRHSSESTRNSGEDTGVNNPQSSSSTDLELGVKDSHLVVVSTNGASRRGVVTPSSVLGELSNLLGGVSVLAGEDLINGNELALERVTSEVNGLGEGSEILVEVTNTGVEVVVDNLGHIERVSRCELDSTSVVTGVSLEDGPGEPVVLGGSVVGVVREVTAEVDWATESKDVVIVVLSYAGLVEHSCAKTGGSVDTAVAQNTGLPSVHAGVGLAVTECAAV